MSVCPDSVCLDSVRCPDFVRIFKKNSVRCLSVRPDRDKTELSGLSLSLSADVCHEVCYKLHVIVLHEVCVAGVFVTWSAHNWLLHAIELCILTFLKRTKNGTLESVKNRLHDVIEIHPIQI